MYKIENNEIDNIIAAWKAKNFHLFIEEEDRSYFVNTLGVIQRSDGGRFLVGSRLQCYASFDMDQVYMEKGKPRVGIYSYGSPVVIDSPIDFAVEAEKQMTDLFKKANIEYNKALGTNFHAIKIEVVYGTDGKNIINGLAPSAL